MGSPISWLIAEAVLQRLEAKVFQTFTPKLWKRYVDDTFVILDTDKLSDFHIALNNALPGIQFTQICYSHASWKIKGLFTWVF